MQHQINRRNKYVLKVLKLHYLMNLECNIKLMEAIVLDSGGPIFHLAPILPHVMSSTTHIRAVIGMDYQSTVNLLDGGSGIILTQVRNSVFLHQDECLRFSYGRIHFKIYY